MGKVDEMSIEDKFNQLLEECVDFNKATSEGFPIYPLYHATTDKLNVCNDGLKPRCELDGKCGLGGGVSSLVSFTTNEESVIDIAKDLKSVISIANGEINWNNYCGKLNEFDGSFDLEERPCKIMNKAIDDEYTEKDVEVFKQGYDYVKSHFGGKTKDQWLEETIGYRIREDGKRAKVLVKDLINEGKEVYFIEEDEFPWNEEGKPEYDRIIFKADQIALQKRFYEPYHIHYLNARSSKGGRSNPIFWGIQLEKLAHLKEDDVGIVEIEGIIPHTFPRSTMYEKVDEPIKSLEDILLWLERRDSSSFFDSLDEKREGWNYLDSMKEFRLSPDKFHKVVIREDLI